MSESPLTHYALINNRASQWDANLGSVEQNVNADVLSRATGPRAKLVSRLGIYIKRQNGFKLNTSALKALMLRAEMQQMCCKNFLWQKIFKQWEVSVHKNWAMHCECCDLKSISYQQWLMQHVTVMWEKNTAERKSIHSRVCALFIAASWALENVVIVISISHFNIVQWVKRIKRSNCTFYIIGE